MPTTDTRSTVKRRSKDQGGDYGVLAQTYRPGRQAPLHGLLPRHQEPGAVCWHLLQQEGRQRRLEEGRGRGQCWQAGRPGAGQADVPGVCDGEVAAASPAGAWCPQQLRGPDPKAPDSVLRADEDARHSARARRQWVTYMQDKSASARTIQYCKGSILNAIFTTALEDEAVTIHPSRGVKTPPVPDKPRHIITADQFDLLYQALPDTDAQLLVETAIESGLRWGELTELR